MLDLLDFDAIEVPDIEAPAAEASADIQASTDKPRRGRRPGTPNRPKEKQPLRRLGYRIGELAEMLGVSRAAIYRAIKAGTIKPTKLGKNTLISVEKAQRILRPRRGRKNGPPGLVRRSDYSMRFETPFVERTTPVWPNLPPMQSRARRPKN